MNDRNLMILSGMLGALVGVGAGYVLFTERGRQLRAELQPEIDTVIREARRLTQVANDFKSGRPVGQANAAVGAGPWPRRTT